MSVLDSSVAKAVTKELCSRAVVVLENPIDVPRVQAGARILYSSIGTKW